MISFDDQLYLFESAGTLIGQMGSLSTTSSTSSAPNNVNQPPTATSNNNTPPQTNGPINPNREEQKKYIEQIVSPLLARMEEILSKQLYKQGTYLEYLEYLEYLGLLLTAIYLTY